MVRLDEKGRLFYNVMRKSPIFDDTKKINGGRTKKKCVGSSVRCWLNLSRRSAVCNRVINILKF